MLIVIQYITSKTGPDATNLHCFDDGDDARGPEAADGGEDGDGQVVVGGSAVHQGNAGGHLHRVAPSTWHVGLTLMVERQRGGE